MTIPETGHAAERESLREEIRRLQSECERLRAQVDEFELVYRQAPVGLGLLDPDLRVVHVNDHMMMASGRPRETQLGRHVSEVVPHLFPQLEPAMRHVLETGESVLNLEVKGPAREGAEDRVALVSYYPVRFGTNGARGIAIVRFDVTDRVRAEMALKQANEVLERRVEERTKEISDANQTLRNEIEERRRVERELESRSAQIDHLLAGGPAVLYACHSEPPFRATFVSENVEQQVGYSAERLLEEPGFWVGCMHPDDGPRVQEALERLMKEGRVRNEYRFRCADGRYRWLRDEMRLGSNIHGEPGYIFGYLMDVTEQKDAEAEISTLQANLAHAARVSTVGEMSAGLAHELHQPLQSILNRAFACQRVFDGCDAEIAAPALEQLKVIEHQALRAAEIIRKLRQYVRKGAVDRSNARLADLLAEVLSFAHGELNRLGVEVSVELEGDPWVFVDGVQVQQVFLNLVRNAIEAMASVEPGQRRLIVRTAWSAEPKEVVVSIEDFGPVVTEEFLREAMDHFSSTKANGLGLGLPISQSIVEAHQGTLTLSAKPSGGVIAQFTLPVPK